MDIVKWLESQRIKSELELTKKAQKMGMIGSREFIVCPEIKVSPKGFRREEKVYSVSLSDKDRQKIISLNWGVRQRTAIEDILANLQEQRFWIESYGAIINSTFREAGLNWRVLGSYRHAELKSIIENGKVEGTVLYYETNKI